MNDKNIITIINDIPILFGLKNGHANEIRCYEKTSIIGNVYVARVSNIVKNIDAAFVEVSKGENCYLALEDYHGKKPLKIGDLVTVQITGDKIKTKQASVTDNISVTGSNVVVTMDKIIGVSSKLHSASKKNALKQFAGQVIDEFRAKYDIDENYFGCIIRTNAALITEDELKKEMLELLELLRDIIERARYLTAFSCVSEAKPAYIGDLSHLALNENTDIITDKDEIIEVCKKYGITPPTKYEDRDIPFKSMYDLDRILEKALSSRVYLRSGAYLVIEPTEAMTVVDVNSGKAIKGNNSSEIQYKINCEAAEEIMRQLRLRNLSGIIMVDFISMRQAKYNDELLLYLRQLADEDYIPVKVVDMTRLGLVEITRKKIRKPLYAFFK